MGTPKNIFDPTIEFLRHGPQPVRDTADPGALAEYIDERVARYMDTFRDLTMPSTQKFGDVTVHGVPDEITPRAIELTSYNTHPKGWLKVLDTETSERWFVNRNCRFYAVSYSIRDAKTMDYQAHLFATTRSMMSATGYPEGSLMILRMILLAFNDFAKKNLEAAENRAAEAQILRDTVHSEYETIEELLARKEREDIMNDLS